MLLRNCLGIVAAACIAVPALGATVTLTDNTAGTASNDGTVNGGEYVTSTTGINSGFGDVIGETSILAIDSNTAGQINIGITSNGAFGGSGGNDTAVIYINSVLGGLSNTETIEDTSDTGRRAISGDGGGNESEITFASGFTADYAITIESGYSGLYQINPSDGSITFISSNNLNVDGSTRELDFDISQIGLNPGDSFDFIATYLDPNSAFRSDEFVGVSPSTVGSGNIGQSPKSLGANDFATFASVTAVPEPLTLLGGGTLLGLVALRRR